MVIHGSVAYSGSPLNLSADPQADLLRCIEYGGQPAFLLMAADGAVLKNTDYDLYCSSHYATWRETAAAMFRQANAVLAPVQGLAMLRHDTLSASVGKTTYENGYAVFVNYGETDAAVEGITVPAGSAVLTKGGKVV